MTLIEVQGRRLRAFGWRVHHGTIGAVLVAIGAVLMAHDRRDLREWVPSR